jgi:hypothetical protein
MRARMDGEACLDQSRFQRLEMLPIPYRNSEVNVQSAAPGGPAENMPKNHFSRGCPCQKVVGLMLASDFVDLPNNFEDQRIDLIMADF